MREARIDAGAVLGVGLTDQHEVRVPRVQGDRLERVVEGRPPLRAGHATAVHRLPECPLRLRGVLDRPAPLLLGDPRAGFDGRVRGQAHHRQGVQTDEVRIEALGEADGELEPGGTALAAVEMNRMVL